MTTLVKLLSYLPSERKLSVCAIPPVTSLPTPDGCASTTGSVDDDGATSAGSSSLPSSASNSIAAAYHTPTPAAAIITAAAAGSASAVNGITSSDRSILIDDISEIRPGKISSSVDGGNDAACLSKS